MKRFWWPGSSRGAGTRERADEGLPVGVVGEPHEGEAGTEPATRELPEWASSRYEAARGRARDRYGSLAAQVHWFQGAFLLTLLSNAVLAGVTGWVAVQAEVVPFVILADPRTGRLDAYGPLEGLLEPDRRWVMGQLMEWVVNARTIYPDVIAQRDHVNRSYAFVEGAAVPVLDEYIANPESDPYALGQRMVRRIDAVTAEPVSGSGDWDLEWTQTDVPIGGFGAPCRQDWRARVEVRLEPPRSMQEFRTNILGVYIRKLNWNPRGRCVPLAGGAPPAAVPAGVSSRVQVPGYGGSAGAPGAPWGR
jgi:type IV secretion system protein VirB5